MSAAVVCRAHRIASSAHTLGDLKMRRNALNSTMAVERAVAVRKYDDYSAWQRASMISQGHGVFCVLDNLCDMRERCHYGTRLCLGLQCNSS